MRNLILTLFFTAVPLCAIADPAYFRVTGVASDDTLTVRAEPAADSADIGELAFNATGIEVDGTDPSGKWGAIIWEEGNGWVAMRFLRPEAIARVPDTHIPLGLNCGGTEPFWSFDILANHGRFSDTNGIDITLRRGEASAAAGRPALPVYLGHSGAGGSFDAFLRPNQCSDDMSDRSYPWQLDLLVRIDGAAHYLDGCCYLPLNSADY